MKIIVWDWDGTLFNNVAAGHKSINRMLENRNLEPLSLSKFRETFTFPIPKFYEKLGLSGESMSDLANEYYPIYREELKDIGLHDDSIDTLERFKNQNFTQIIVSAMEETTLRQLVKKFGIFNYFKEVFGVNNLIAENKVERAKQFFAKNPDFKEENRFFIGDTYHDYEVAKEVGCKPFLVNRGFQNLRRFDFSDAKVFDSLDEIEI